MKPGDLVMYEDFIHKDSSFAILLEEIDTEELKNYYDHTCKIFVADSGEVINISIMWLKPI